MLPLRWCSITSVYTPLSTALFLLFKCLSISLTQHSFTVSYTKILVWSDPSTQAGSAGSNGECHRPPFSYFRHEAFETLGNGSCVQPHRHTYKNYSYTLSGQQGDGWSVGAVSITADIVCHHHNGVGFRKMPAREKKIRGLELR